MLKRLVDLYRGYRGRFDFYIAGPMRGYPDLNSKMFSLVSNGLRSKGFTVWSPSEHESYLRSSFAECMIDDLNSVVNRCRKIVLLPGWSNSLGANMEAFSAFACGKEAFEVVFNDDKTDFDLVLVNLSAYRLPYKDGETKSFNPHICELDSFIEKK